MSAAINGRRMPARLWRAWVLAHPIIRWARGNGCLDDCSDSHTYTRLCLMNPHPLGKRHRQLLLPEWLPGVAAGTDDAAGGEL